MRVACIDGLAWRIGAEGEGAEHILLPVAERTILIVRQFRTSGNPPAYAIATVLQSLAPTNRSEPAPCPHSPTPPSSSRAPPTALARRRRPCWRSAAPRTPGRAAWRERV